MDYWPYVGGSTNTAAGMPRLLGVIILYILVLATVLYFIRTGFA